MPILEILAIKGLAVIGKAIVTKGLVSKAAFVGWKAVSAFGLSNTITATFVVGVVVGGICWTKDRVNNLRNGFKAIQDGNVLQAALNFAQLAISSNIEVRLLPDAVHDYLIKIHVPADEAAAASKLISSMEDTISEQVRLLK